MSSCLKQDKVAGNRGCHTLNLEKAFPDAHRGRSVTSRSQLSGFLTFFHSHLWLLSASPRMIATILLCSFLLKVLYTSHEKLWDHVFTVCPALQSALDCTVCRSMSLSSSLWRLYLIILYLLKVYVVKNIVLTLTGWWWMWTWVHWPSPLLPSILVISGVKTLLATPTYCLLFLFLRMKFYWNKKRLHFSGLVLFVLVFVFLRQDLLIGYTGVLTFCLKFSVFQDNFVGSDLVYQTSFFIFSSSLFEDNAS